MNQPKITRQKLVARFTWNGRKHQKTFYGENASEKWVNVVKDWVSRHFHGATEIEVKTK